VRSYWTVLVLAAIVAALAWAVGLTSRPGWWWAFGGFLVLAVLVPPLGFWLGVFLVFVLVFEHWQTLQRIWAALLRGGASGGA
jgi:hypothetical protein